MTDCESLVAESVSRYGPKLKKKNHLPLMGVLQFVLSHARPSKSPSPVVAQLGLTDHCLTPPAMRVNCRLS